MTPEDLTGYIEFETHELRIRRSQLWNAIQKVGINLENVKAVVIFGSCLGPIQYEEKPWKFLWWNGVSKYPRKPNDLDVAVFLDKGSRRIDTKEDLEVAEIVGDYGGWWEANNRHKYLHILTTTEDDWRKAIENKESVALHLMEGWVVYGSLSPMPIPQRQVELNRHNDLILA